MKRLFVSHVEEDQAIALELARELDDRGYSAWCYELDALPGQSYVLATLQAIAQCKAFVLLVSGNSMASHEVDVEVERAHILGKPIVPVLLQIRDRDYKARKPLWAQVVGTRTSTPITKDTVRTVAARIASGLLEMGIQSQASVETHPAPRSGGEPREAAEKPEPQPELPVLESSTTEFSLESLEKNKDHVSRLVRQKRWSEAAPTLFCMLSHSDFAYPVFYGAPAVEALLATGYSKDKIREQAEKSLTEMVLTDSFLSYLLNPLIRAGVARAEEGLDWYRKAVDSHEDSNNNRGMFVSCLIDHRLPEEAIRQIRKGCDINPRFFKYSGEEFYDFMRKEGHDSEAEALMEAAEGRSEKRSG